VLLFSNPKRMFRGLSTGVNDEEDNARVIALSAPFVRDYYPPTQNTGPRCEFRITFDGSEVPVAGATRTVVAERTRGDCQPEIASLDPWVRIEIAPNATAERTEAQVTYLANDQALSRRGHFVVGEQPVTIEQTGAAACLMANGSFNQDLSDWTVRPFLEGQGTASWSPLDVDNSPSSGSVMIAANGPSFGVERCVAMEPSSHYILRSSVFMPPGQRNDVFDLPAYQMVTLYDTPDCSGSESSFGDTIRSSPGKWQQVESHFDTRANTHSANISLNVGVAAGPFTTHFDDVYLCRVGNAQN